jgi:hypothetical protein
MILAVLNNIVKKYEDEYGQIKKPKAIETAEKKQKKAMKAPEARTETPSYLG